MAHKKSRHRHIPKQANPAATGERAILPLGALMFAASMSSWAQTADDDTKTLKPVVVKATGKGVDKHLRLVQRVQVQVHAHLAQMVLRPRRAHAATRAQNRHRLAGQQGVVWLARCPSAL